MISNSFVDKIIKKDRKTFFNDLKSYSDKHIDKELSRGEKSNICEKSNKKNDVHLIADFTEYNPFHNGHLHNLNLAKKKVPNGIFVAILPGLFERSGRGTPYIMTRYGRAEIAISLGADIIVEGPPMGIMGSGQYSLSLALMFQALNTDCIPRGYNPSEDFNHVIENIKLGKGVAPKPYKIVDIESKEVLLNGKLKEDNYVIVSLSKSLHKINFDFKNKFIFIKRIENVSGTKIRKAVEMGDFNILEDSLPKETIAILKREINENKAPLHNFRSYEAILNSVNKLSFKELLSLNLINEKTAINFIEKREKEPFNSIYDVIKSIPYGFSTHFQNRVLSVLESNISKDAISKYINNYPQVIRVLQYKNENVLDAFKAKINGNKVEIC
ncbi:MAG: nucleotidyltransferase family protein [Methanobrevibacter sp.]|jgi:predicted nucleotidyltransferase|nr:nucleotidyltransferase family protein [Candidatus Methanovirga australis]